MSLIAASSGAAMVAGHPIQVFRSLREPLVGTANADKCFINAPAPAFPVDPSCNTTQDNAFGVAWLASIAPGASETKTSFTSYTSNLQMAHLTATSAVAPSSVDLGENTTYTLSIANEGPDQATGVVVEFALPPGLVFQGMDGDGDYDATTATWSVPALDNGSVAAVRLTAKAQSAGTKTTKISAITATSIDQEPCQILGSCGADLNVEVSAPVSVANTAIVAGPGAVVANGSEAATITVTAADGAGEPILAGGATVELTSDLGTVGPVTDHGDGTYTAAWRSSVAGLGTVGLIVNGAASDRTATVSFVPGVPSPISSTITAAPDVIRADGSHETTATVTLIDHYGNIILDPPVSTVVSIATTLGAVSATTSLGRARYSATLSSAQTGAATVSFGLNGTTASKTAAISYLLTAVPTAEYANGSTVAGRGIPGNTIIVRNFGGDELGRAVVNSDGSYAVAIVATNGDELGLIQIDMHGIGSETIFVSVDGILPEKPEVKPTNGSKVEGLAEPGTRIVVKDANGATVCGAEVDQNGKFSCVPEPKPRHGAELIVTVFDRANNESESTRVIVNQSVPAKPVPELSDGRTVTGGVIAADHNLVFVDANGTEIRGVVGIDPRGRFVFTPSDPLLEKDKILAQKGILLKPGSG